MPRFGPQFDDRPVLAVGETKYHGEPVALVVADTRDARRAGRRRWCGWTTRSCPAVFTIAGALAPDAPLVQDPSMRKPGPLASTNVLNEHRVGWGDVDAPATADVVVEHDYTLPDGHPLRHRAARVHGRARRRRGSGVEHDPAPELAPEDGGRRSSGCRCRRFVSTRRTRAAASAASSTRSWSRRSCSRRCRPAGPVRLVLDLEETFQAVRRAACEVRVRTGSQPGRHGSCSRTSRRTT